MRKCSGARFFFLVLAISTALAMIAVGALAKPVAERPEVGYLAPDFTLPTADGGTIVLSELKGKRVFLNFWATWCPPCRSEMPAIQSVWEGKDSDVAFIAVNIQEAKAKVAEFVEANGYTFPVALDGSARVASGYLVRAIPTSFVIGPDGVVTGKHIGVLTAKQLETLLEEARP